LRGLGADHVRRRGHPAHLPFPLRCEGPDPADEAIAVHDRLRSELAQEAEGRLGRSPDDPGARAPSELHREHADAIRGVQQQVRARPHDGVVRDCATSRAAVDAIPGREAGHVLADLVDHSGEVVAETRRQHYAEPCGPLG
jgi:hypothetical protein